MVKSSTLSVLLLLATTVASYAQDKIDFLLPATANLPAFAPYHIAKLRGFYRDEKLDVTFRTGKGGADVATQVGAGNADLGGAIGDTPIIVRVNGVPVRNVAVLGAGSLHQVIARKDAGVNSLAEIKGKKIGIASVQDTSYYNLLGVLASQNLSRADVDVQQVGFVGMIQLLAAGERQVIVAPPEWAVAVIARGTEINTIQITNVFPAMAQSIMASDKTIQERPELVRRFVRATLRGVRAIMENPDDTARTFFKEVSQSTPEDQVLDVMKRYVAQVYATNPITDLGKIDPKRIEELQAFYLKSGIIRAATPTRELYTNEFVP